MGGRLGTFVLLTGAVVVAACGDQSHDVATAPEFAAGSGSCNYTTVSSLTKTEFGNNSPEAGWAGDVKFYGAGTSGATYSGYKIFQSIAGKYAPQPSPYSTSNASKLTVALLRCMNVGTNPSIPDTTAVQAALGTTGAFGVRGLGGFAGQSPDHRSLFSHDTAWVIQPDTSSNWQDATSGTTTGFTDSLQDALLVYGRAIPSGSFTNDSLITDVFDWATLPKASFSPGLVIGECTADPNYVQHNNPDGTKEVLGYVQPNCDVSSGGLAMGESATKSLAARILSLFRPDPLQATMLTTTGSGGSKGSLSPFGVVFPGQTVLSPHGNWKWSKSGNTVNVPFSPSVIYDLKTRGLTPFLQPYVLVWLEATNNQGSKVLICDNWGYTNANGVADLSKAYLNKAGGYTVTTKTTGAFSITVPGVGTVNVPTVPPSAPMNSPLINIKNDTSKNPPDNCSVFVPNFDANGTLTNPPSFPGP